MRHYVYTFLPLFQQQSSVEPTMPLFQQQSSVEPTMAALANIQLQMSRFATALVMLIRDC